eukprot:TRINITY_DN5712_c0_g1_i1.p2 TRINITY_DN5712_c0_g1~~TRINITY_DN5712_c0_g1_i1.p2  ORF type:complete len:118 (+),score=10.87 TRINITY_DN5712_c0_g1_i1:290-643(+)
MLGGRGTMDWLDVCQLPSGGTAIIFSPQLNLLPKKQPIMLYIDVGTDHDTYDSVIPVLDALQKSSYPVCKLVSFVDQGAGHNEKSWGARFYHPMIAMFPPPPAPNSTHSTFQLQQDH